ncbi:MAG: type I-E CRISPR-associated protein Cse2/CasB [Anaerolineae bacterium]
MNPERTYEHPLVAYLLAHQDNRAMLAALRRGLGMPPGEAPDMLPFVVPFVNYSGWSETVAYVIASLFGLHPSHTPSGNMGAHVRRLAPNPKEDGNEAVERRFTALLRADAADLEYPLRQMISLLKSNDIPVNWHQLMSDVLQWNDPERRRNVVRRWASSFWNPGSQS